MSNQPFFKRKWVQIGLAIGVITLGVLASELLVATAPTASRKPPEKTARLVTTEAVESGNYNVSLLGYGVVQAEQQVTLQARVSGTVQSIGPQFVPGATFKKGDVLVQLDNTDYRIELQTAQASLAQAQSNLTSEQGNQVVAQSDFELLGLNVDERERALILRKPQLEAAKATVQSAQAGVERAKVNLDRTVLRAPFDGVVVSREASVGAQVSASSTLGVLASSKAYWVSVAVPQADVKWINFPSGQQKGSTVCVNDASSREKGCHKGYVLSLQTSVQDNGRQAQVLIEIPRTSDKTLQPLLLAQYVKVRFEGIELKNVFKLAPSTVHDSKVWVNDNGELDIRPVNIAFRSAEYVLIDKGLKDGEHIVTSNLGSPVNRMAIRTNTANASNTPTPAAAVKP
ncbi:RND family efflux transporter MFP subunit [Limnobacter thiooxidans]|uniref:Efflux RND transporter periplasmic adaptor subunit n=1 Tax=Limnobacter thiooxidans TaxID=131080 RepID=A0AA86IY18_9BURK|nr:RND family efflux transporter MFP subunit [Limnobacter thiooxidans]BET25472.1 efflux RND transporter periplasmic adaptor subunit [Limnobacter thiooxidans]